MILPINIVLYAVFEGIVSLRTVICKQFNLLWYKEGRPMLLIIFLQEQWVMKTRQGWS